MSHIGLGWRSPHYQALLERREPLAFLEVHSENFFAEGGAAMEVLRQGRELYDISLHGVGLGLGSAAGIDRWHLDQLAALVERVQPVRVSDHASFARAPLSPGQVPVHGADLLPVAFSPAALDIMVRNVQQVQDRLRRPLLVENLSAYVRWTTSTMSEAEFLNELTRRSGCGLLLDVNNLVVNALNAAEPDPVAAACAVVDALLPGVVGEIHLAGYNDDGVLVIDDHGSRVHEPVWQVYAHALARLGQVPTLIEWDTDVPELDVLLDEVRRAERVSRSVAHPQREAA
ncbi:DUF692 domain-containing protein [Ideonella paludis]|uniref:DUF692 domain-containing protein n=1 Tax=Ideonella paludis TaxID=1233411 RepID=A0ABS5E2M2_9BURK|nr:DUF692 domain-containing protein [Ideonella paludis]MBQ0937665.1 DUF692 domain-containing protein [Ideonella paludis]